MDVFEELSGTSLSPSSLSSLSSLLSTNFYDNITTTKEEITAMALMFDNQNDKESKFLYQNNTIENRDEMLYLNGNNVSQMLYLTSDNVSQMLMPPPTAYFGDVFNNFNNEYRQIHGGLSLTVCVFGIIANVLNIIVLTRKNMISPTNAILTGMAVSDLLVIASYIPYVIHNFFRSEVPLDEMFTYGWAVFTLFHAHNTVVFHTISIWLTVLLAVWRYLTVRSPTSNKSHCSMARAKIAIVFTYAIVPVFCIPVFMCFAIYPFNATQSGTNATLYKVDFAQVDGKRHKLLEDINFWAFSVLLKLVPCILLTCLSLALIRILIDARKRKERLFAANFANSAAASNHHHHHHHHHPHHHHHHHHHQQHHHNQPLPHSHPLSLSHPLQPLQPVNNLPKTITLANDSHYNGNDDSSVQLYSHSSNNNSENSQLVEIDQSAASASVNNNNNNNQTFLSPQPSAISDNNRSNQCQNQLIRQNSHNLQNQSNYQNHSPEANSALDTDKSPTTAVITDHILENNELSDIQQQSTNKSAKNQKSKSKTKSQAFLSRICSMAGGATGCHSKHQNQNGQYSCCGIRLPIKTSSTLSSPTSSIPLGLNHHQNSQRLRELSQQQQQQQTSCTELDTLNSCHSSTSVGPRKSSFGKLQSATTSRAASALQSLSGFSRRVRSKKSMTSGSAICPCTGICTGIATTTTTTNTNISLPHSSGSSERTTKMLIAVLIMFLVCEFPSGILSLLSGIFGEIFYANVYNNFGELMDMLALINSAVNFVLYCFMSQQFRKTFSQLFCIRWTESDSLTNSAKNQQNHRKQQQSSSSPVNKSNSIAKQFALRTLNRGRKFSGQLEQQQQKQRENEVENSEYIVTELIEIGDGGVSGAGIIVDHKISVTNSSDNNNNLNIVNKGSQSNISNCSMSSPTGGAVIGDGGGGGSFCSNSSTSSNGSIATNSKSLMTTTAVIALENLKLVRSNKEFDETSCINNNNNNCKPTTIGSGSFGTHITTTSVASSIYPDSNNNNNGNSNKAIVATVMNSTTITTTATTTATAAAAAAITNSTTLSDNFNTNVSSGNECELIMVNSINCFNNTNTTPV